MTNLITRKEVYKLTFLCENRIYKYSCNPVFSKSKKCYKIYIVKRGEKILYIGQTIQDMKARIRTSLSIMNKQKSQSGYHGYKWVKNHLEKEIILVVYSFENLSAPNEESFKIIETIESEIVFYHRNEKGVWPLDQHEIHFHNDDSEKKVYIKKAEKIYKELSEI